MNCAARVYCPPELEGESLDPSFQRFRTGLGLTQLNIFPHFAFFRNQVLDGKAYVEEILLPDSFHTPIYAICDGAYFLLEGDSVKLYGEGYLLDKGRIKQLSEDGQVFEISKV
jgi:dipeptidase E